MKEFELSCPIGQVPEKDKIVATAARTMGVPVKAVAGYRILRRSVDARGDILYRYRILAYVSGETCPEFEMPEYRDVSSSAPVIIIGAGPAGMFAALRLLTAGLKPVILERGKDVHARKFDIAALSRTGQVDEDSNYCFGEGGAGTFSDGKLYTRSSSWSGSARIRTFWLTHIPISEATGCPLSLKISGNASWSMAANIISEPV